MRSNTRAANSASSLLGSSSFISENGNAMFTRFEGACTAGGSGGFRRAYAVQRRRGSVLLR